MRPGKSSGGGETEGQESGGVEMHFDLENQRENKVEVTNVKGLLWWNTSYTSLNQSWKTAASRSIKEKESNGRPFRYISSPIRTSVRGRWSFPLMRYGARGQSFGTLASPMKSTSNEVYTDAGLILIDTELRGPRFPDWKNAT